MKKIKFITAVFLLAVNSVSAQWTIDSLSAPYWGLASTQNGSKCILASASNYQTYDFTTGIWSNKTMPQARPNVKAATANGKSYFGGGGYITVNSYNFFKNVDIYNGATNTWTTNNLSTARIVGAAAAVGNKVLFAGGRQILNYSNRVDIFDVVTGIRSTYTLSQARTGMAVAVVGSKVIFAGGETGNISNGVYTESNKVDIYDNATGTWSTAILSSKREQIVSAVVGSKVLFAGGIGVNGVYSNRIDVYDAATNVWSTLTMSEPKYGIAAATAGNMVYLAGGTTSNSGALTNRVEVYNAGNNTLSFISLSSPRMAMAVAQTPKRIMFAGGNVSWGNVGTNRVEVLDLASNTWSVEYLSQPRIYLAAAQYGNKALFAGGAEVLSSYALYSIISKRVDIWTDPAFRMASSFADETTDKSSSFYAYPNPFSKSITIQNDANLAPSSVSIYDWNGKLILTTEFNEQLKELDLSYLASGIYFVRIISESKNQTLRLVKN